jgi:DNA repair exonuclease SbcCD ATPase subunit
METALVAARIGGLDDTLEVRHRAVVELQRRLKDSGYLEIVDTLLRRQEETGMTYTQAVENYQAVVQRSKERKELEELVQALQARRRGLKSEIQGLVQEAAEARAERDQEGERLQSARENAKREVARLDGEVARAREGARVSQEEIETAREIRVQVEEHDLDLGVVLAACQEFGTDEGATERLAIQLKENRALTEANAALQKEEERREKRVDELDQQIADREGRLAELTQNVEEQHYLRHFHKRYDAASPLLEHMGTWGDVALLCCPCGMKFAAAAPAEVLGLRPRQPKVCPNCGGNRLMCDEPAHRALDMPVGFIKIPLPKVE